MVVSQLLTEHGILIILKTLTPLENIKVPRQSPFPARRRAICNAD